MTVVTSLTRALLLVEELRKIGADMPVSYVAALLRVAEEEGVSQTVLMRRIGSNKSTIQRIVNRLTDRGDGGAEGYGVAETRVAPHDARIRQVYLTPKGRRFVASLLRHLGR